MSLKILVISNYRATPTVRPEAEIFLGLQRQGFDITVMSYGDSEYATKFREAGIRLIDWHPKKKYDRKAIATIRAELQSGQYDVLHLFSGRSLRNGIAAARGLPVKVALYRGCPCNIHWYDPTAYSKFLHPRVDGILCNSIGVEEYLRAASVFVKPFLKTVNKGHDLDWYKEVKALPRADLGLPKGAFAAVCVANNRRVKGIPYLLKAWQHLPTEANIHLLLVGKDMDNAKNMRIIEQLPQPDRIHILGWRSDSLQVVKTADVFVLASIFGESITKAVLESMSLATPAIITDLPGNRELLEDAVSGVKVPLKDPAAIAKALLHLQRDEQFCQELGKAAQARIRTHFQPEQTQAGYAEFYRQLTAS